MPLLETVLGAEKNCKNLKFNKIWKVNSTVQKEVSKF